MLIQSQPGNRLCLRPALACTHAQLRHLTARPSRRRLVSWSVSDHRQPRPVHTKTRPDPISTTTPERPEDMRPLRPCLRLLCPHLVLFLSLLFLAGLAGCGPAPSDNVSSLLSRANVSGPPLPKQGPSPGNNPLTPVAPPASPVPLSSGNEAGAVAGNGKAPVGDSPQAIPASSSKPADVLEPLVVPAWIAKELDSPDVGTRLRALETWAESAPPGAVDPLILAYEDKDERVRARAMELIEQDWARAADTEK
jgi:hypothetical protein